MVKCYMCHKEIIGILGAEIAAKFKNDRHMGVHLHRELCLECYKLNKIEIKREREERRNKYLGHR